MSIFQQIGQFFARWLAQLEATFIEKQRYLLLVDGLKNTLVITLCALVIGVTIGALVAMIKYCGQGSRLLRPLCWLCDVYTTVIRGIPVVVQLLIFYFLILKSSDGLVVGIVTFDDAMDVMQDEATEDMEKMAAMLPSEHPYLRSSPFEIWKNRIPWLMLLMISATLTGLVITSFEDALGVLPCLTAFIPMLMDTGGNSGSQSSVTIIRSLSLAEIRFSDIFRIMFKEMRVALLCGATLAVVNFGKLMLFDRLGVFVSLTVSLTLLATVVVAKFFGCTLPLLVKKIGLDPAVMASPIITTIVDAIALLIYFAIASAMLGI